MGAVCVARTMIIGDVTNGSAVDADRAISCTSDDNAYPPAEYRWTNDVDGFQSTGPQFVLKPGTQYKLTCNASNNFDRRGCYATDHVQFNSKLLLRLFRLLPPLGCIVIMQVC